MSAPSSWRAQLARWLRRGAAAVAGGALDALLGSLGSRSVAVAAVALVLAGGVAWAAAHAAREDRAAARVPLDMERIAKPDTQEAVRTILAAAAAEREAAARRVLTGKRQVATSSASR
jgi:hypothetical protein